MESRFPNFFNSRTESSLPLPQSLPPGGELTALYQHMLRQNQLVSASCQQCQHTHFPPKSRCPRCHAYTLEPVRLSGRGQLHSADISSNPEELSLGHILLEEGFWVRALLVGAFENDAQLTHSIQAKPVDVVSHVLCTQGVSILAFKPAPNTLFHV
ncbi:Zn-ribbon domain-containing OB-fold protein [Bradymonas sediminis]|uniref:ChsH2 rubredoxin-like zinc ribbon domain-containing protein n=1 Tax=Bradymonas sediminis TaxID=1548548 RepID=A0A2Z4FPK8_9DELT|nr:zinc ribbon domain-containing protein [Bradymonas sediminis]AWV90685.1 hypothetical protein DN745_15730 [Bradymonas sediminis]TDP62675.1 rubredoxin-like zinc ribbon protein [Bradymonas sediminis]